MSTPNAVTKEINVRRDEAREKLVVQRDGSVIIRDDEVQKLLSGMDTMTSGQQAAGIRITINIS